MAANDLLPDCRSRERRGVMVVGGAHYVPVYCANCGAPGGGVPEEHTTFAFYLCNGCVDKHGTVAGVMLVPDEVFFERVRQAQLEKHGRLLNSLEAARELDDPSSGLSKLAREAPKSK